MEAIMAPSTLLWFGKFSNWRHLNSENFLPAILLFFKDSPQILHIPDPKHIQTPIYQTQINLVLTTIPNQSSPFEKS